MENSLKNTWNFKFAIGRLPEMTVIVNAFNYQFEMIVQSLKCIAHFGISISAHTNETVIIVTRTRKKTHHSHHIYSHQSYLLPFEFQ